MTHTNGTRPPTLPGMTTTESQLTRRTPPSYSDGVYMMAGSDRPSPRYLSQVVMKGEDGLGSARNLTTIFAFFGKSSTASFLCSWEGCHCAFACFMAHVYRHFRKRSQSHDEFIHEIRNHIVHTRFKSQTRVMRKIDVGH